MNSTNRIRRMVSGTPPAMGILLTFFALLLMLAGCEKGTLGIKGGSISGYVLDSRTLAGISDVTVAAETGTGDTKATKNTKTDSQGNYYMGDLRPGEWFLTFDKIGYQKVYDASDTVSVVVVNNEHRGVPEVRMVQNFINQYIMVRGTLKDARNGTLIQLGTAQFIFGNKAYSNRLPTELQTGFSVPAEVADMQVTIKVTGYQTYTTVISNAVTDRDLGVILLQPQTYSIVGVWKDIPGWVYKEPPTASVIAYSGNRVVATASASLSQSSFELKGIPMGVSASIEIEVKGFRMNGSVLVVPNSDFEGTIYQTFSLKNNFAAIMRDVRVMVVGTNISSGDRVGAYCNESGAIWPTTVASGNVINSNTQRVIDLGVNQVPTGYTLTFTGFNVDDGTYGTVNVFVNDDGVDPQIVNLPVS